MMGEVKSTCLFLAYFVLNVIETVNAEICDNGYRCDAPLVCCEDQCCYDSGSRNYTYRLSFYNLWYFWFVLLFVVMSCFGGCGYYKQRQRFLLRASQENNEGITISPATGRRSRRTADRLDTIFVRGNRNARNNGGYAQHEDEVPPTSFEPPPYTQVMMQPDLYPSYKTDALPPYPGLDASSPGVPPIALPQPPPYSPSEHTPTPVQPTSPLPPSTVSQDNSISDNNLHPPATNETQDDNNSCNNNAASQH